jgi:hypothetical protein
VPVAADREFGVTLWRAENANAWTPPGTGLIAAVGYDISVGGIAVQILEADQQRFRCGPRERLELLIEHGWERVVIRGQVCHLNTTITPGLVRIGMNFQIEPMTAGQRQAIGVVERIVAELQRKKLRRRSYYEEEDTSTTLEGAAEDQQR